MYPSTPVRARVRGRPAGTRTRGDGRATWALGAGGRRSGSCSPRQRLPLRSPGFSSAVSVTGVAGAAEPPAPGGAQLCSGAAEAAVPPSCTASPSPAGPPRHLPGQSRRAPAGDSPESGQRMPGGGQAGGSTSNLRLPSNLGRRSAEHMTFC